MIYICRRFFVILVCSFWFAWFWLDRWIRATQPPEKPARRIRDMSATALNDRRCAGTRCPGFLGQPTVVMLG